MNSFRVQVVAPSSSPSSAFSSAPSSNACSPTAAGVDFSSHLCPSTDAHNDNHDNHLNHHHFSQHTVSAPTSPDHRVHDSLTATYTKRTRSTGSDARERRHARMGSISPYRVDMPRHRRHTNSNALLLTPLASPTSSPTGSPLLSSSSSLYASNGNPPPFPNSSSSSIASVPPTEISPKQRYRITKRVARSIYGQVVQGVDLESGSPVAIKLSSLKHATSGISLSDQSFVLEDPVNECEVMRHITPHPNIVNFVAEHVEPRKNRHWIVLELVGGGELFDYVIDQAGVSEGEARSLFSQIVDAVAHLHLHEVAHLDLSLENILLDAHGVPKLCDFGVARILPSLERYTRGAGTSSDANHPGKLRYMAPEVFEGYDFDAFKADSFSLGVILFCLLTGSAPYESPTHHDPHYAVIAQGNLEQLLQATGVQHRVSPSALSLLSLLLNPSPEDRPDPRHILEHEWVTGRMSATNHYQDQSCPIVHGLTASTSNMDLDD